MAFSDRPLQRTKSHHTNRSGVRKCQQRRYQNEIIFYYFVFPSPDHNLLTLHCWLFPSLTKIQTELGVLSILVWVWLNVCLITVPIAFVITICAPRQNSAHKLKCIDSFEECFQQICCAAEPMNLMAHQMRAVWEIGDEMVAQHLIQMTEKLNMTSKFDLYVRIKLE